MLISVGKAADSGYQSVRLPIEKLQSGSNFKEISEIWEGKYHDYYSRNISSRSSETTIILEEIHPLIHSSREESGNVSYDLYKDTEKENVYTMVEVWKDEVAVASHNTSEHFTSSLAKQNSI